jgi:NADP-dependent 3-hydroxy acid dehydrogenase YdfG
LEYAKHGSKLILCARRASRLQELKQELRTPVHTITLDVRDRAQVFQSLQNLPKEFQDVDILVNNAGLVIGVDPVETVAPESVDTMFDTNVKGLLNVTQAVLPGMKERNRGWIVNVGSIAGTEAYANGSIYCATKHSVNAITKSLRHELNSTNINVISIEPGMVETEFSIIRFHGDESKAKKVYEGLQPLTGEDIAETIAFTTSRPPHVQIASVVIFPTNQSAATTAYRKQ